jgi:hypothetical protein
VHRLYYVSSGGERVDLDGGGAFVGTAPKLRSRVWTYTLGWRGASGISRAAREAELDAVMTAERADELRRLADRDVSSGTPGTLVFDGEWYQRAYIAKSEVETVYGRRAVKAELTVLLLDGAWRREVSAEFYATETEDPSGLDHPHDFEYDYGGSTASRSVTVGGLVPADLKLTVYGPVANPRVAVSQGTFTNVYEAAVEVPGGSRLVIDGSSHPKSIQLIGTYGEVEDKFASGLRGEGAGSGSYCFEPLRPGTLSVAWDGSFAFTMTHYQEEGEPPWSS